MKHEIMQLFFLKFEQLLLKNNETYPFEININNLDQLDYMQYRFKWIRSIRIRIRNKK